MTKVTNCILGRGLFTACVENKYKEKQFYNGNCLLSIGEKDSDEDPTCFIITQLHKGIAKRGNKEEGEELLRLANIFAKEEVKAIEDALYQELLSLDELHIPTYDAEMDAYFDKVKNLQNSISNESKDN